MEKIKETIEEKNVRIELKVLLPYSPGIEHCITTVDGNKRWGFINKPTLFADIYYYDKFAFTLTQKEFADYIMVDITNSLSSLEKKVIAFLHNGFKLNEGTSWYDYAVNQRNSYLAFLPNIFKGA
jgi:hypothetical protein